MLPPAVLHIADRLSITLMTLVDAVGLIITNRSAPIAPDHPAQTLFFRLATIITTLIRLSLDGPRTRAAPKSTTPADPDPAPLARHSRPDRIPSPRRRPGWILDVLPDIAPAVASDLAALLADPAFATLLATAPTLHRKLRPLLRGLGLTPPHPVAPSPPPDPPSPATSSPEPPQAPPTRAAQPALPCRTAELKLTLPTSYLRTSNLLRYSNNITHRVARRDPIT